MLCDAYERLNLSGVADPSPPAERKGTAAYIDLECNYYKVFIRNAIIAAGMH